MLKKIRRTFFIFLALLLFGWLFIFNVVWGQTTYEMTDYALYHQTYRSPNTLVGPKLQTSINGEKIQFNDDDDLYIVSRSPDPPTIAVIDHSDSIMRCFSCQEVRNFKNGPLGAGYFNPGAYGYDKVWRPAFNSSGDHFFSDGRNESLRWVHSDGAGGLRIDSVAGCVPGSGSDNRDSNKCDTSITVDVEYEDATELAIGSFSGVTVDSHDQVWIVTSGGKLLRLWDPGDHVWHAKAIDITGNELDDVYTLAIDSSDMIYGVARGDRLYWKYDAACAGYPTCSYPTSFALSFGGSFINGVTSWDGAYTDAKFNQQGDVSAKPDGSEWAGGNGDEHCWRRIYDSGGGLRVSTFTDEGQFYELNDGVYVNGRLVTCGSSACDCYQIASFDKDWETGAPVWDSSDIPYSLPRRTSARPISTITEVVE